MRVLIVLSAAAAAAAAPAHAAEPYGKVFGGATLGSEHDFTVEAPGAGPISGQYDTDTGYTAGGALGYNLSRFLSVEGEVAYRSNEINIPAAAISGDDDLNALSLMGNVVLKAPGASGFTPYAGVGAGGVRLAAVDESDVVFAYQAFGGVSKDLSENLSAGVEYRYLDANEAAFGNAAGSFNTEYDSHGVNLTLTRKF